MESISRQKRWDDELSDEQKQMVEDHSRVLHFEAGETIIKQGIAATHIMYLEQGMVKLTVRQQERHTTFKLVPSQNFIGIMCSFVKQSFDFYAIAVKPSTVRLIDRNVFEELIGSNGSFAIRMVELMSLSTNKIVHDLISISQKNVDGALCTILLEMARIFKSDTFQMPFTRIELADMIGYSKESVIHSLSSLQRDNILKISGKNVDILDSGRLELISRHG